MELSAFLLRLPEGAGVSLAAAGLALDIEPLFKTALPAQIGGALTAAAGPKWEWHIARPKASVAGANAWELAHEILTGGLSLAAGTPVHIEPDLIQEWLHYNPIATGAQAVSAGAPDCVFNDQIANLPGMAGQFAWHLGDAFSQSKSARDSVGAPGSRQRIRIAHLDTGYDADHKTFRPERMRLDLQRNFMDDRKPNDARDPAQRGLLKNPGHGTGTLSILAGGRFQFRGSGYEFFDDFIGGTTEAEIIPVRVGKSVVQIYTSSVAAGISYAVDLCASTSSCVHVISMSMGGVASQAWADAVNKAYEAGVVYVAAAGNNFSAGLFGVPTHLIVYPARFRRVVAACGVMADAKPYFGLPVGTMQGNWGPASKMATALAAYTPNMPWAELGCAGIVDMNGAGTSSATPQVAAAAALYLQKHAAKLFSPAQYPEAWMRIEAVRHALFISADRSADGGSQTKLGNGILQAARALAVAPPAKTMLRKTPADSAAFAFLRVLTGLGVAADSTTQRMLALEATQLAQQWDRADAPNPFEGALPDPDLPAESISPAQQRAFLETLLQHPMASRQLKQSLKDLLRKTPVPPVSGKRTTAGRGKKAVAAQLPRVRFNATEPAFRRLRGFALDPSLTIELETAPISQVTFRVPWEPLAPGPVGEYLEVIDVDHGSNCCYEPVRLDDPLLLAQDGIAPSEGTPQFHQQMVYAVASLTIRNFERALGRRTLWRPGPSADARNPKNDSRYVQRLRIYPHALRERNAYYAPQKIALLFGYFTASCDMPGDHIPGGMVFASLSHDIIAHETTHALLDGLNRSYLTPTNRDVHAFHEAFADLVALLQHFTFPEILRHQINSSRGQIRSQKTLLGELAGQFGRGSGLRGALRDAIGKTEYGDWRPHVPDPQEYEMVDEPHARGAILVAAAFDAFLSIYERRTEDLLRLATGGTGILQPGAIHPDLVRRLAQEAAKSAQHVLTMCVRALDYCPPVDITFGEFLRAIITADVDLVEDDDLNYRIAFLQAFRRRGIYPRDVRTLSVESLLWRGPHNDECRPSNRLEDALVRMRQYANNRTYTESRELIFQLERGMRRDIHEWLRNHFQNSSKGPSDAAYLGLDPKRSFEVRSARIANRTSPDGEMVPQLLLMLLQRKTVPVDPADPQSGQMSFDGGCTLVANLREKTIRYCIRKSLSSTTRLARQQGFAVASRDTLRTTYLGARSIDDRDGEPFAAIHRGV